MHSGGYPAIQRGRQDEHAGDAPSMPAPTTLPPLPNAASLRAEKRRTYIALGLCAGVLFVAIVAYVSFMTTVELAALSQSKRDVTAPAHDRHRGGNRRPHTRKHSSPPHAGNANTTQAAADF